MAIFRGDGGAGDANTDVTINSVTQKASEAAASATAAASSATSAATSASNASTSESNASTSATAAASSASSAATSATNASTSASTASTQASNASTSATAASTAQTAAEAAQTAAETAETNAGTSATNAAASATTATTKASEASTSATNAATSATTATTKASEASTSASNAATSASNASTSETNAASSASAAATSATNAATSATSAANSATAAAAELSTAALKANNLSDLASASTARTNLGLGTAATTASTDYATAAQGTKADSALQNVVEDTTPQLGGNLDTQTFTVDGRDVSTDGTKLDTIETNADVTDTANVTAAGALMDSEVTNLAQVKAFSSADYATAAQGTTADSALQNVSEDTTPQLGGNLDVNGNSIVSVSAGNISITPDTTGKVIIDGLSHPTADGSAGQFLKTDGAGNLSFATPTGKVVQVVSASDATTYALSTSSATDDQAGSIAYSITPTSSSNDIVIHFTIPHVKHTQFGGLRMRVYRQIAGGGYSHVTGLSGTAASSRQASLFGNYDTNGDGNRAATTMTGTVVDSPATTSQVDYKFYFGTGDGADSIYVNRTQNDTDAAYTHRTRTHCTLMEVE